MPVFLKCLLILHIAGGTAGLISGTIASSVTKGNRTHKLSGKIFFWAMLLASVAALVLSNLPGHKNVFLFAVGGFTFYMICSGYRIVHLKRSTKQNIKLFAAVDYAIFLYGLFLVSTLHIWELKVLSREKILVLYLVYSVWFV